ncbi:PD-(D/E)XK nuclease family protein [Qipengyuania sp. JC766]|uniref:PD-(D/E)XK nuclease family protein n=2 Tax=Pseudomonadati TaxID=3379134 RepID=UPI00345A0738
MSEGRGPAIYSIAAHRGFADALVAGLVPRYGDARGNLPHCTLLLPSSRAIRTVSDAFVRHYGTEGRDGLLMPRMVAVGDLDLDEVLGPLLDPLGDADIPPAVDPMVRRFRLAAILKEEMGETAPEGGALLRYAAEVAAKMDRLLVEDIAPDDLLGEDVLGWLGSLATHWEDNLHLFARVQARWLAWLQEHGRIDGAARRNRLFSKAAERWRANPPANPVIAAGVTSAAPALARLLRVVTEMPQGAVVLPDFDLTLSPEVWDELGRAGAGTPPFAPEDAVTHPQYHLKLLLNRMAIAREEVKPWHRKGMTAAAPERSHAVSTLFLPPEASRDWVALPADKRRLAGVRIMECATSEEEAQAVALLVRQALLEDERRVAVVTPDRGLAQRLVHHLRRWNIAVDDSAGTPLAITVAGRVPLLLAEAVAEQAAPVELVALLHHPLVRGSLERGIWLDRLRAFDDAIRGPRQAPGLAPLAEYARKAGVDDWWQDVGAVLSPLVEGDGIRILADWLDAIVTAGEALCGEDLWAREDGRSLSALLDEVRMQEEAKAFWVAAADLPAVISELMNGVTVRRPYGGHPRVALYGLLEARMSRADLTICAGLNEGSWPATPSVDPLLAPAVLRALGVPGADFRIGLAAHDLAGAMGAPEVILSRAARDSDGPTIPSRFLLRVKALLGDRLLEEHRERDAVEWARALDAQARLSPAERPRPMPSSDQRRVKVSVTALDRLRSDPYQFYAGQVLRLVQKDGLDAEPSPAWRGTVAHEILETWHKARAEGAPRPMMEIADETLEQMNAHPLMRALWEPRLMRALQWVEQEIEGQEGREPIAFEQWGSAEIRGVTVHGKVDRIDRMEDGSLAIVDYKTGGPPSNSQVEGGYALQLGTLGILAEMGAFEGVSGTPAAFEYWSLASSGKSETGFGYVATPIKTGSRRGGIPPEEFLPQVHDHVEEALDRWILGAEPFTARLNPDASVYDTYDQLMRLEEWMGRGDE